MRLGIIGGGQLARMLALAARPLGIDCLVVEPAADPPAGPVAEVIRAGYDDPEAMEQLARRCAVITVELEAVPISALEWLALRVPVHPGPAAIATAADRLSEKQLFRSLGIATASFDDEVTGVPAIVKTRRGGFDGRGNRVVSTKAELETALDEMPDPIVEGLVPFTRELSIICARSTSGDVGYWPVVENAHEHGILRRTTAPAPRLRPQQQRAAEMLARLVAEKLEYVGVLAIELFELADGTLVANEMAPRVHNSGHWTIEGALTNQFEQHVRAVCGLPLGDSSLREPTAMLNCVGRTPDATAVLKVTGAHLHVYGKAPRPGRKVGHVTVTAPDEPTLAVRVRELIPLVPFEV